MTKLILWRITYSLTSGIVRLIDGTPLKMRDIAADLRLICPGEKLWFTPTELYQVWKYEREHPEIFERCDEYMRSQGIKRIFTTAK